MKRLDDRVLADMEALVGPPARRKRKKRRKTRLPRSSPFCCGVSGCRLECMRHLDSSARQLPDIPLPARCSFFVQELLALFAPTSFIEPLHLAVSCPGVHVTVNGGIWKNPTHFLVDVVLALFTQAIWSSFCVLLVSGSYFRACFTGGVQENWVLGNDFMNSFRLRCKGWFRQCIYASVRKWRLFGRTSHLSPT